MENLILIIVLYVIGSLISDKANEKKRRKQKAEKNPANKIPQKADIPSSKRNSPFDFEIPKLEGAPNSGPEPVLEKPYEENHEESYKENRYLKYLNKKKEEKQIAEEAAQIRPLAQERRISALSRDKVREGIILAEILGKPKALKYRRR